jgi:hypothetical protein
MRAAPVGIIQQEMRQDSGTASESSKVLPLSRYLRGPTYKAEQPAMGPAHTSKWIAVLWMQL